MNFTNQRINPVSLGVALVLCLTSSLLSAATIDDLQFTLINGDTEYSVSAVDPKSIAGEVDIPATYNGKAVTEIGTSGFGTSDGETDRPDITSVNIPTSIQSIGTDAFRNARNLSTVTFAEGSQLTSLGSHSFHGCYKLASIDLPASLTSIGEAAFQSCSSLTSIVLPDSITVLSNSLFTYCNSLSSVDLPASLTSIENEGFYSCSSLTSINLPASLTSIGDRAFFYCLSLTSINLPESLTSIGEAAFAHCSTLTSVVIPDSITTINDSVFSHCNALTSVVIPDSVTSIGNNAFVHCITLASVELPASLTSIGDNAFRGCNDMASITFQGAAPTLGEDVFLDTGSEVGGSTFTIYDTYADSFTSSDWDSHTYTVSPEPPSEPVILTLSTSYTPGNQGLSIVTHNEDSAGSLTLEHTSDLEDGASWTALSTSDYQKDTDAETGAVTRTINIDPATNPSGFYRLISADSPSSN